jgi:chromosome segregation ATPase
MKFSELATSLDKALEDIKSKKAIVDDLEKKLRDAVDSYQSAMASAHSLREQVNALLSDSLGATKPKIG